MKKIGLVVSLLVLFISCLACTSRVLKAAKPPEVVIEYATFEGHPVEMVFDPNDGDVILRLRFSGDDHLFDVSDKWLAFLKDEVLRLTSADQSVVLGNSEYRLFFLGGHPIWGPYTGWYVEHNYKCLCFAERGSIRRKTIYAYGAGDVKDWNGYKDWEPSH